MATRHKLLSGYYIPSVGLGTWLSAPGAVASAVKVALYNGYRHIDCATAYQNQTEIGIALEEVFNGGLLKREDVFITSKVWNTFHSYELALKNVEMMLSELRINYLDLCLIHWPHGYEEGGELFPKADNGKMRYSQVDYLETWHALEDCVESGKIRTIGVSNFNHHQVLRIIENCKIKPSVLQVERHPYFQNKQLLEFCEANNIILTAYSPLANPSMPFHKSDDDVLLEDPVVVKIANKYHKTPAQVILRWHIKQGTVVVPKSVTEKRIIENIDIFDFDLTNDDMHLIDSLDRNWRILDLTLRDGDHPLFPFNEDY